MINTDLEKVLQSKVFPWSQSEDLCSLTQAELKNIASNVNA